MDNFIGTKINTTPTPFSNHVFVGLGNKPADSEVSLSLHSMVSCLMEYRGLLDPQIYTRNAPRTSGQGCLCGEQSRKKSAEFRDFISQPVRSLCKEDLILGVECQRSHPMLAVSHRKGLWVSQVQSGSMGWLEASPQHPQQKQCL